MACRQRSKLSESAYKSRVWSSQTTSSRADGILLGRLCFDSVPPPGSVTVTVRKLLNVITYSSNTGYFVLDAPLRYFKLSSALWSGEL